MTIGQIFYHTYVRSIHDANKKIPKAVHLLLGWVLNSPFPSSSGLLPIYFKGNAEDVEHVSQVKAWYGLESYGTHRQADARSVVDQRAHNFFESTTYHDGKRYWVGMLWADDCSFLPKSYYSVLA